MAGGTVTATPKWGRASVGGTAAGSVGVNGRGPAGPKGDTGDTGASTVDALTDAGAVGKLVTKGETASAIRATLGLGSAAVLASTQVYQPINPKHYGATGGNTLTYLTAPEIAANTQWIGTYTTADTWDFVGLQEAIYAAFATESTPGNVVWNGYNKMQLNRDVLIPSGQYRTTRTLLIKDLVAGRVIGTGKLSCKLYCNPNDTPTITTNGCSRSHFADFYVRGFDLDWDGTSGGTNANNALQSNTFVGVNFDGTNTVAGGWCCRIGNTGYMGSENLFLNCFASNGWNGYEIRNYNALQNTFVGGNISGCPLYGILVSPGSAQIFSVGFQNDLYNTQVANSGADVGCFNSAGERTVLYACRSESMRLVIATNTDVAVRDCSVNPGGVSEVQANTAYTAGKYYVRTSGSYSRYVKCTTSGTTGATITGLDSLIWTTWNYLDSVTVGTAVFQCCYIESIWLNGGEATNNKILHGHIYKQGTRPAVVSNNVMTRPESELLTAYTDPTTVSEDKCRYASVVQSTGTTLTLALSHCDKVVETTNGSGVTVTLPRNLPKGYRVTVIQAGAGQVTFAPDTVDTGATLVNRQNHTKTAGQYAQVTLTVRSNSGGAAAVWVLADDTAA